MCMDHGASSHWSGWCIHGQGPSQFAFGINTWIITHFSWGALFYMPAGFAFMIYLTKRFFPGIQGSGIPQVIAVIDDPSHKKKNNLLSIKIIIGKVITLMCGLIMGASIGMKAPCPDRCLPSCIAFTDTEQSERQSSDACWYCPVELPVSPPHSIPP